MRLCATVWTIAALVAAAVLASVFPGGPVVHAQDAASCTLTGSIAADRVALPGVALTLASAIDPASAPAVSSSAADGTFVLKAGIGQYRLRAELTGFAPVVRDLVVAAGDCPAPVALTMQLASRVKAVPESLAPAESSSAGSSASVEERGRTDSSTPSRRRAPAAQPASPREQPARTAGPQRGTGGRSFRSVELVADSNGARTDDGTPADASLSILLPPGFSADAVTQTVAAVGGAQSATVLGPGGRGAFGGAVGDLPNDGTPFPGPGGPGGRGGGPGGPGGPGGSFQRGPLGGFSGLNGRGRQNNQIRGSLSDTIGSSALDAAPFALNGQPTPKPEYLQQRLTATIGGPLTIPKLVDSPRTFFFANYTGNHSASPYDAYSTVPTLAERTGDLSALGRSILDPQTGVPFPGARIPVSRLDGVSQQLLGLIPVPNQSGDRQNFHTVTTSTSNVDDINVRVVRNFGTVPQRQGPGARGDGGGSGGGIGGGGFGGAAGGFGGASGRPGGRGAGTSNLNVAVHYRHASTTSSNPFPTLGGTNDLSAWDVPGSFSFSKGRALNTLRFDFNRQHTDTLNLYAFAQDVAGQAGVLGASSDPFDWGAPDLSFSTFAGLHDLTPATRTDRTLSVGDSLTMTHGPHTVRMGGDYRDIVSDSRTDRNARGAFVFSGLYTGLDFADFLLGLPQQSRVQYGPGLERFRSRSWDLFVQDDWRASAKLTVNVGVRYEYLAPYVEADNRLVTLDAAPDFTAAVPVGAGGTGPYAGELPDSIVRPYRGGLAPRTGVAWRVRDNTIVRAGYGVNYNTVVYQSIAQQLAGQPPYAAANTVLATLAAPVPLGTALLTPVSATLNTYGVDPNLQTPFAQIWNAGLQRDLTRTVTMDLLYTGTKGLHLDLVRAPNRNPDGSLRIGGVVPFLWESSEADSISNSLTMRLRKRMSHGFAASAAYTLAKSSDDASSIGGTSAIVAQNDQNLAAERGLSSFDQRHRMTSDATWELPFGEDRRWLTSGPGSAILGHWQLNVGVQLASGTPFTARVLGAVHDVATGVNGTLRANYNGEPIPIANPTTALFFNTAAFSVPAPGTFGTAGRNTIIGPGSSAVNLALLRSVSFSQTRSLAIQVLATNVLNTVQYASIDTIVNSPTFGQVTAVRPMRRLQLVARFRF